MKINEIDVIQIIKENKYLPTEYGGWMGKTDVEIVENSDTSLILPITLVDIKKFNHVPFFYGEVEINDVNYNIKFKANISIDLDLGGRDEHKMIIIPCKE